MSPQVGYSVDTPGYRVWDPEAHKVWDVRGPDSDEVVRGGWWRKPVALKKFVWEDDGPLRLMEGLCGIDILVMLIVLDAMRHS